LVTWRSLGACTLAPALLGGVMNWVAAVVIFTHQAEPFGLGFALRVASLTAIASVAMGSVVALAGFYLVALPVHFLLEWRGIRSALAYVLAGAAASLALAVLFLEVPALRHLFRASPWFILPGLIAGGPLAAAGVWWGLEPDEDPK